MNKFKQHRYISQQKKLYRGENNLTSYVSIYNNQVTKQMIR